MRPSTTLLLCLACGAAPPPPPTTTPEPTAEPPQRPLHPRRIELFYTDVVSLPDGQECAVAIDVRICFRGDEVTSKARDPGREWAIEAHHREGALFFDRVEGAYFRAPTFTGEPQPTSEPPGRRGWSDALRVDGLDRLFVWNGHGFLPAQLPGRVVQVGSRGDDIVALVEPGDLWTGSANRGVVTWTRSRSLRPAHVASLNERFYESLGATAGRLQRRVNDLLAAGELELGRRSERRWSAPEEVLAWAWSTHPERPPLKDAHQLPPFGLPDFPELEWSSLSSGPGRVRWGHPEDEPLPTRTTWMGLGADGRSFVTESDRGSPFPSPRWGEVAAVTPAWSLVVEFQELRDDTCVLVLHRRDGPVFRREWGTCDLERLGTLQLPMSEGRTGVLVHHESRRLLLELDGDGRLLAEREILGPHAHHDELIREVDGRLAHVVAFDGGVAHVVDGEDRPVAFPSTPTGLCTDRGRAFAASHLSPPVSAAGSTADHGMPRMWRSYWLGSTEGGTCVRAGFEVQPPLAWWSGPEGVRGMTWDLRYGPTELDGGDPEPTSFPASTAIQPRGETLFVARFGQGPLRLVRVDGSTVTPLGVPGDLRLTHPVSLGPGGVLFSRARAWVPSGAEYTAPEDRHILDAIATGASPGELFLLLVENRYHGEISLVDGTGASFPVPDLDELDAPILVAAASGPPTIARRSEALLVPGRGRQGVQTMLLMTSRWPSAQSCAHVEVHGSPVELHPPIDCLDSPLAVLSGGRVVAYQARALGGLDRTHVRVAGRQGGRWREAAPPLHVGWRNMAAVGVGRTLYVVTSEDDAWTLHELRGDRWTERALPLEPSP